MMNTSKFKEKINSVWHSDTFYKVVSVLVACVIWYGVAMNNTTAIPHEVRGVPVTVENQTSFITRMGLTIIGDEEMFSDVTIEGKRSVVGGIGEDDLSVSVDFSSVNGAGVFTLPLVAENVSGREFAISAVSPSTVTLKFDRMVTKKFGIDLQIEGLAVPAEGYLMEEAIVSPTQISVTGPDADIAKIASCVAFADHDGELTESAELTSDIVLLDKEGNPIDTENLTMDVKQAQISVPILKTTELPVKVEFLNVPDNVDPEKLKYTLSHSVITAAGPVDEVDEYSEILLGYIDMKALDLDSSFQFDVVLPEGFTNIAHVETVTVEFDWTDMVSRSFTVTNLQLLNIPRGYEAKIQTERLTEVTVIGPAAVMESLTADDLVAVIDLSKRTVEAGQFKAAVAVSAPAKDLVWAAGEYTAVVSVVEKNS
ncbi:MAG: hypothetical protein IJA99_04140 [Oscillospiraceae bacterium]|nr:hypothetical protein [Oscillospiraceae bacterium]